MKFCSFNHILDLISRVDVKTSCSGSTAVFCFWERAKKDLRHIFLLHTSITLLCIDLCHPLAFHDLKYCQCFIRRAWMTVLWTFPLVAHWSSTNDFVVSSLGILSHLWLDSNTLPMNIMSPAGVLLSVYWLLFCSMPLYSFFQIVAFSHVVEALLGPGIFFKWHCQSFYMTHAFYFASITSCLSVPIGAKLWFGSFIGL